MSVNLSMNILWATVGEALESPIYNFNGSCNLLLHFIVKLRKAKRLLAKGCQAGHLKGSAFTLTSDLNKNDTKFRYASENLPWTHLPGMFYLLELEREIS